MIEISNVSKNYGAFEALKNCSARIERGQVVVICGPSGSGKSTLIKCINGLEPIDRGHIAIDGKRLDAPGTDMSMLRAQVGMVFQNFELFPHLSILQNLTLAQKKVLKRSQGEAVAKAEKLLHRIGLAAHIHKFPGQLSGGQQQRVAIARAIAIEPSLVLMDEPLSNLDAKLRLEMRQEIRRIHLQQGATTVYVTHDQEEALSLADRIVVMRDGQVQQVGSPAELHDLPIDLAVADFMGFRNRLAGRTLTQQGERVTVAIGSAGHPTQPLTGRARRSGLGEQVVLAVRPDDLSVQPHGLPGLLVTVELTEYRGRGFQATGKTADGQTVYFSVGHALRIGDTVNLASDPDRALVYPA
jgi:putative spermidine/putrescine transport system ATP-binding protein